MINDDLLKLIERGAKDQAQLLKELNEKGYNLTQSTVSRKLKQLGIKKIAGKYQLSSYFNKNDNKYTFVEPNLIVIQTRAGNAQSLAAIIDNKIIGKYENLIATIAGDDTIFLACNTSKQTSAELINIIRKELS